MFRLIFIIICILLFVSLYFFELVSIYVVLFYLAMSVLTFFIYVIDKSAARNNRWRVRESTLHYLAILGGWYGALFAQQFIDHKSTKKTFLLVFYSAIGLNIALFVFILNSEILLDKIINKLTYPS